MRLDMIRVFWKSIRMSSAVTSKKTYNLPPDLIARAQTILNVRTETEAVVRSLEEVVFMDDVARAVRATAGKLPRYQRLRRT